MTRPYNRMTICRRGHRMTEQNTKRDRRCRTCHNERERKRTRRQHKFEFIPGRGA